MNELQIVVKQQPGTIQTNFAEVKKALTTQMDVYKELEVTEANKPERKKDIAVLRKMQKAITDKKSEVRMECLKPYEDFNKLCGELTEIIDEPIKLIDNQVKEFEERQRQWKIKDINDYFAELIHKYPILEENDLGIDEIYDGRWENATASMKSVKDDMTAKLDKIQADVTLIQSMQSDKAEEALRLFWGDLNVTKAITLINNYEAQKREIQAREEARQRQEREAELEREKQRVRDEERRRIQEEERIRNEERLATEKRLMGVKEPAPAPVIDLEAPFDTGENELPFVVPGKGELKVKFIVTGTEEELQQVEMYLNSIGLLFERWNYGER